MATHLPHETYATLAAKVAARGYARIAPNTSAYHITSGYDGEHIRVELYGHTIASLYPDGRVWLSDAGYPTVTTLRRLRALAPTGYWLSCHAGKTYVTHPEYEKLGDVCITTLGGWLCRE